MGSPWRTRWPASERGARIAVPQEMRALGVDFGEIRIGLALSDETGTLATPMRTLRRRRGKRPPLGEIEAVVRSEAVEAIVVGLPLELSGSESEWSREVRGVAEKLAERTGLPVHLVDERMTSVRAERLVRGSGLPLRKREEKDRLDAAAAALILQSWLDRCREGA